MGFRTGSALMRLRRRSVVAAAAFALGFAVSARAFCGFSAMPFGCGVRSGGCAVGGIAQACGHCFGIFQRQIDAQPVKLAAAV
ncbi:hypothetical protein D3C87_1623120 [compost metagenome]